MKLSKLKLEQVANAYRSALSMTARLDQIAMLTGKSASIATNQILEVDCLWDIEFQVFSQWGEDGIIEWLVHHLGDIPETFIEFGVENYRESNTRFLLVNRNWRGLVIDGSEKNVQFIKDDDISWRHDLTAVSQFITAENINDTIDSAGFHGPIGILSVDIDGMDYWVWDAISCVDPIIVIAEFNSSFGDLLPLTTPYAADFFRTEAHFSNLYWGASPRALEHLANSRGYTQVGTNRAGSNIFFVKSDRVDVIHRIKNRGDRPARFRESLDESGTLNFTPPSARAMTLLDMPVKNVETGETRPLGEFGQLFSDRWKALLNGRL